MKTITIYISSPIDRAEEPYQTYRDRILEVRSAMVVAGMNVVIFAPRLAFEIGLAEPGVVPDVDHKKAFRDVVDINAAALMAADVVLLFYSPGVESWGVPYEMNLAHTLDKRVIVITSAGYDTLPIYLMAQVSEKFVVPSISAAARLVAPQQESNDE